MKPTTDAGVTNALSEAVKAVLPALEQFSRFDPLDLAAAEYTEWRNALDEPLPSHGAGAAATIEILRSMVIPHGTRIGAPGFSGWITTMPTTVPTVAAFSASMAGAQRWWLQSYNFLEFLSLEWLKQLLHIPLAFQGVFSSGGSTANLIALGAARSMLVSCLAWTQRKAELKGFQSPVSTHRIRFTMLRFEPRGCSDLGGKP